MNAYYYKALLWAVEKGIVMGTGAETFRPEQFVTRGQVITFMSRMNGVKDNAGGYHASFSDVSAGDYYANAIAWAAAKGIASGTNASSFSPDDNCLRGQGVTFLYRCFAK